MLSEVSFAACYIYSPRGQSETAIRSRHLRDWVKAAHPPTLAKMARRVRLLYEDGTFADLFGPDTALMPVPGSTPRKDENTLWVSERICDALLAEGLANAVMPNARRVRQVPKSAYQTFGNRPNAQTHYESIAVEAELMNPARILLVDDIVTKGSTLLGCASRASESYPEATIRTFAMVRTMGLVPDIDTWLDPCVGRIVQLPDGEVLREP